MAPVESLAFRRKQSWPALFDRRTNLTLRHRFAAAERVLRVNSPRESVQSACLFGLERLQRLFPDVSRATLADLIETVWRVRCRRDRSAATVPAVMRPRSSQRA